MGPGSAPYRPDRPSVAELAAGAVVVAAHDGRFLLLHELAEDRWCFPKGHVEPGESLLTAAQREVREECGLTALDFHGELGEVAYRFYQPRRDRNVFKTSVYFLAVASDLRTELEATFDAVRWEAATDAKRLVKFETDRRMLSEAEKRMASEMPDRRAATRGVRRSSG